MDNKNEVIENQNVEKDQINEKKSNNCFFIGGNDWIENKNLKKKRKEDIKVK
ncbi:hypothetical protein HUW75_09340 [Fusobacterium polymorphum]|uniref:hypothetical protein n=1 Tax=Fusobacterium nucleatum subsp. polymorphum TaxID=76857 RepID=UPI0030CBD83A